MFVVHLYLTVSPANRLKVVSAVRSTSGRTSAKPGLLKYGLYCDVDNDDALILVEEWESTEELHRYIRSDDFRIILSLMDLAEEAPEINIHEVSSTAGLDLVGKLRTLH